MELPRRVGVAALVPGVLIGGVFAVASLLTDYSYWARIITWREAGFDDFQTKFAAREIADAPSEFPLRPASNPPSSLAPTDEFVAMTGTTALIALKDDELLVERYANRSSHEATQTSFSVAKSFDSTLVGIAIAEGLIGSVDDPIVAYLPELRGRGLTASASGIC
jgi:hypothetical protein